MWIRRICNENIEQATYENTVRLTSTTALYSQSHALVKECSLTLEEHLRKVVGKYQKVWHFTLFLVAEKNATKFNELRQIHVIRLVPQIHKSNRCKIEYN